MEGQPPFEPSFGGAQEKLKSFDRADRFARDKQSGWRDEQEEADVERLQERFKEMGRGAVKEALGALREAVSTDVAENLGV